MSDFLCHLLQYKTQRNRNNDAIIVKTQSVLCLIITIIPCKDFIAMVQFGIGFKAEARGRSGQEDPGQEDSQLSPFSSRASSMSDTRSLRESPVERGEEEGGGGGAVSQHNSGKAE